ncbi:flagellar export apparatus protein FliQ [Marinobacterium zhoushanense]|uniref:Flagellar biosynthetic protein FliQ n=1 Tax=Marinobacterium zhoushanense TaxID=1679163 RepID=A0ABQ1KV31_9GAMM|nr:flagellar biosynthesis protein FliQ [Marinobacterium zhoushanense]GGC07266.1 flagellar export apparatus protein FliQ [Marinobacterium zhoushanense]
MTTGMVLDLFGGALWLVVLIVTVIVMPGLMVGLIVSIFQAATQINEQMLSFLPRLIVTLLALMASGPWIVNQLMEQFNFMFTNIPRLIG